MNQVAKMEPQGPVSALPVQSETAAFINMIERAARDPAVDMEKMRGLMEMARTVRQEQAEEEFNQAMAAVQAKMRAVAADANNPQTKSKYASYFALDKAIRPFYSAEGLALSFDTEDSPKSEHVRIVCYVTRGRHTRKYHFDMPADGKGAKGGDVMTKTHAAGSAATYGQRYLLKMIFNIAIGEDDDGNAAGSGERISPAQAEELKLLCETIAEEKGLAVSDAMRTFCEYFKISGFADLPSKDYESARIALNKKRSAK